MRKSVYFFLLFSMTTMPVNACTQVCYEQADKEAICFQNWEALYAYNRKYGLCIGIDTAESLSESVVRLLADKWDKLYELEKISNKDSQFKNFVFDNITTTVDSADLLKIHERAVKEGRNDLTDLCKQLDHKAMSAFDEMVEAEVISL